MKERATEGLQPLYSSTIEDVATREEFLEAVSCDLADDTEEGYGRWRDYVEARELSLLFSRHLTEDDEIRVIDKNLKKQGINGLVIAYLTHGGNQIRFVGTNGEEGTIEALKDDDKRITGIRLLTLSTSPFSGANSNLIELNQLEEAFREAIQSMDKEDCRIPALIGASSAALRHTILHDGEIVHHLLEWAESSDPAVASSIVDFIDAIISPF